MAGAEPGRAPGVRDRWLTASLFLWAVAAGVIWWGLEGQEVDSWAPVPLGSLNLIIHVGYGVLLGVSAVLVHRGVRWPAQATAALALVAGLATLLPIVLVAPSAVALLVASLLPAPPAVPAPPAASP